MDDVECADRDDRPDDERRSGLGLIGIEANDDARDNEIEEAEVRSARGRWRAGEGVDGRDVNERSEDGGGGEAPGDLGVLRVAGCKALTMPRCRRTSASSRSIIRRSSCSTVSGGCCGVIGCQLASSSY